MQICKSPNPLVHMTKRNPKYRTLTLREEIFQICGCSYVEAFLLEFFLSGEFDIPVAASLECLGKSIFNVAGSDAKVQHSVKRLLDKGFIKNVANRPQGRHNRSNPRIWLVDRETVDKAVDRLGVISPRL